MKFEHDQRDTSVTETELNRIRQSMWERCLRALYDSLSLTPLDPERAAAVAELPEDVKALIKKVFRGVHAVEPSALNVDRYLNEHKVFIQDLAHYSVKFLRNKVTREYILDDQDLAALPKLLCHKKPRLFLAYSGPGLPPKSVRSNSLSIALPQRAHMPTVPNGLCEWIVQRCTQRWIETELQYEDWPAIQCPVTQTEMLEKLKYWSREYPDAEFRGHNVTNCKCEAQTALREPHEP